MRLGISTASLYPMRTEEALALLGEAGVRVTEIFFNSQSELSPDFLARLLRIRDRYGMTVRAVHPFTSGFEPFLLFSEYVRRFEDSLALYRRYFETARALGAPFVILHGERAKPVLPDAAYFERFARLSELAADCGVRLLQENVHKFRAQSPDFIRAMRAALPRHAAFVLDLKQAVRAGHSPFELMDAMGGALCHVHLSDHADGQSCLLPGRGQFDFARFFAELSARRPDADGIVEVYRSAYSEPAELTESARRLEALLARSSKIPPGK